MVDFLFRDKKYVNYTAHNMNSDWILLTFFTLYDLAQEYLKYKLKRTKITELVNSNFERFILNIIRYASRWFLHEQGRKCDPLCLITLFIPILSDR